MSSKIKVTLAVLIAAALLFYSVGGEQYKILNFLQETEAKILAYYAQHPLKTTLIYLLGFTLSVSCFLPFSLPFLLLGGMIFGTANGAFLASAANTAGATVAFLFVRYFFYEDVRAKFHTRLSRIDKAMRRDGVFYLAALRIAPVLPGQLINLLVALTPIRLMPYMVVTFISRYPINLLYCNIGMDLAQINDWKDVVSGDLLIGLAALVAFMIGSRLGYMCYVERGVAETKPTP